MTSVYFVPYLSIPSRGPGDVLSGDSSGNITVWARGTNTVQRQVRGVHDGAVFALLAAKDGSVVTGGGKDGRIVLFDADMNAAGVENVVSHTAALDHWN